MAKNGLKNTLFQNKKSKISGENFHNSRTKGRNQLKFRLVIDYRHMIPHTKFQLDSATEPMNNTSTGKVKICDGYYLEIILTGAPAPKFIYIMMDM